MLIFQQKEKNPDSSHCRDFCFFSHLLREIDFEGVRVTGLSFFLLDFRQLPTRKLQKMEDTEPLSSSEQKMDDASTENPVDAGAVPPSSDDSGESDSDSEDEAESNHQIQTLESELSVNPYNYDAYVQVTIILYPPF